MSTQRTRKPTWRSLVSLGLLLPGLTLLTGAVPSPASSAATVASPNAVLGFGAATSSVADQVGLPGPVTAIASVPSGGGYWVTSAAGKVLNEGSAPELGSITSALSAPIIAIAATPTGKGYWLVGADGGIFTFGDAHFWGSTGGLALNKPIVGMAPTSDGKGYWLVASDGGIFSFGDAVFHGSTGALKLNRPVVGMAATPSGNGYWLVASDGGIFTFGDATFDGSTGAIHLAEPIVGMSVTPDGGGYRLVASDGGIFDFGDAVFEGSVSGAPLSAPVVGMATRPGGYWVAYGATDPLGTVLGQQEALAGLGYLPLSWSPRGFEWLWPVPAALQAQWSPGNYNAMTKGAIMAFEAVVGLPADGAITGPEVAALQSAANAPGGTDNNPNGYSYALASEAKPESLTVWHNGVVVETTSANTGGAGTPTAQGTFPVYLRLRNQVMRGTNPNGSTYADPVQFVAYFNGGDALHYMPRASYGDPQSLGCVELPYTAASIVWPYMYVGSLVTVV
jgi:peptidoglycan hydrolase-like protein with peptidoglycan-binding domain